MVKMFLPMKYLVVLIGIAALVACQGKTTTSTDLGEQIRNPVEVTGGAYTDVNPAELQAMLQEKDFAFVNVHIPFEGDIPQTDLSIPYDQIEQNLDQLPEDKTAKIVLYCRSDRMSMIAAEKLVGLGYSNVFNLDGGMVAWERAGLPIEGK